MPPHISGSRRRPPLWARAVLLIGATGIVALGALEPLRQERALKAASLSQLRVMAAQEPRNAQVFYLLGLRAQRAGQHELALSAYRSAVRLNPDDVTLQNALAAEEAAVEEIQSGVSNHLAVARFFQQEGRDTRASQEAAAAAKLEPANRDAWQLLGEESIKGIDYPAAVLAFEHIVALAPDDWRSYDSLGDALLLSARMDEALASYRKAVRLAPEQGGPHLELGQAVLKSAASPADLAAASRELVRAVSLKPTLTRDGLFLACLYLGESYQRQKRWKDALPWLQRAAQLKADDMTVHYALAGVYRGLGDRVNADREMRRHHYIEMALKAKI